LVIIDFLLSYSTFLFNYYFFVHLFKFCAKIYRFKGDRESCPTINNVILLTDAIHYMSLFYCDCVKMFLYKVCCFMSCNSHIRSVHSNKYSNTALSPFRLVQSTCIAIGGIFMAKIFMCVMIDRTIKQSYARTRFKSS
jgi:hypothetical protein